MATLRRSPIFRLLYTAALGSMVLLTLLPGVALGMPLVAITRPTQGATVTGVIWIDVAFRSDSNRPISRLEVYIDDTLAREMDLTTPMLEGRQSFNWDFSYAAATTHKISARAIDTANAAAAASISVQVQNAAVTGTDRIPPVVRIYYPAQGAKLHGLVEVKAEASDNVGVELVYFYIDGRLHKMMMNAPPYVDAWDTTRDADGNHVLEAVAVDAAENEARSAQVTVIVENHNLTTMNLPRAGALHVEDIAPEPPGGAATPAPLPVAPVPPSLDGTTLATSALPAPAINPPAPAPSPAVTLQPWDAVTPSVVVPGGATEPAASSSRHDTVVVGSSAPRAIGEGTGQALLPAPAPGVSGSAPSASKMPDVAPLLPLPCPKVAVIVPRTEGLGQVPVAPSSTDALLTLGDPQTVSASRTDQLSAAPAPSFASQTSVGAGLTLPGVGNIMPTASATSHSGPKAMAPTLTQERPPLSSGTMMAAASALPSWEAVAIPQAGQRAVEPSRLDHARAVSPNATLASVATTPSRLAPAGRATIAVAKSAAPSETISVASAATRLNRSGSGTASRVAAQPSLAPRQVVTPIGLPVAMSASQPVAVQPITAVMPEYAATPGLARTTAPASASLKLTPQSGHLSAAPTPCPKAQSAAAIASAPSTGRPVSAQAARPAARVAAVTRPPIGVAALTQAALAEYRGATIPASRMLAMLPSNDSGKLQAEGKVTTPDKVCAAVPIAKAVVRDIKIAFDGEMLSLRAAPETRNGISLAPLREIFEKTDGVLYWLPVEKKVEAVNKHVNVKLTIGDRRASVNGETETLQIAPFIKQGRTMVPLQFIADVLDVKIVFDNGTGQILISSNQF